MSLDGFYIGKLKGVGKVWQLTACDAACSYALATVVPRVTVQSAIRFLREHVVPAYRRAGHSIRAVLTDGGPEWSPAFTRACQALGIQHRRTKPRHAWTNGFADRLQGTILAELWRVAFRRTYYLSSSLLGYANRQQDESDHEPGGEAMVTQRQGKLSDPFFSLIVFSLYSGLMGAILLFVPRMVLPWFGVREEITSSTYMLGFVLMASSFYYFASGIGKDRYFAYLTVYTRFASPVVTIALYLTGNAPTNYVPLSILDALGGVWTLFALRRDPMRTAPEGSLAAAPRA